MTTHQCGDSSLPIDRPHKISHDLKLRKTLQIVDSSVEYAVEYVNHGSVVIDLGRNVATYPLPHNIDLMVGQKVIIDNSGTVALK